MGDRRTSRSRKIVDYSKFADDGFDDDDDFANPTPPPTKKQKKEPKAKCKKLKNDVYLADVAVCSVRPKKERLPLDDKIYERELQMALDMSVHDVQDTETSQEIILSSSQDSDIGQICGTEMTVTADIVPPVLRREDVESSVVECIEKENAPVLPLMHTSPGVSHEDTDGIEILEETRTSLTGRRPRNTRISTCQNEKEVVERRGVKRPNDDAWDQSDSDVDSEATSADDWDAEDSDFDDGKSSKKQNKKQTAPQKNTKTIAKSKTPTNPKGNKQVLTPKTNGSVNTNNFLSPKLTKSTTILQSPTVKNSITSVKTPPSSKILMKSATPSGLSSCHKSPLGGVAIKSPYSGGIRLGLSKKARIKPLHSTVTMPH